MKVGDLVKLTMPNGSHFGRKGLLIDKKLLRAEYRLDVFIESGKTIDGVPERYIEVISEMD
jgi:hypothetical protein